MLYCSVPMLAMSFMCTGLHPVPQLMDHAGLLWSDCRAMLRLAIWHTDRSLIVPFWHSLVACIALIRTALYGRADQARHFPFYASLWLAGARQSTLAIMFLWAYIATVFLLSDFCHTLS